MGPLPNGGTPKLIQYLYMGVIDPITTEPQVLGAHPPGRKGPVFFFSNRSRIPGHLQMSGLWEKVEGCGLGIFFLHFLRFRLGCPAGK